MAGSDAPGAAPGGFGRTLVRVLGVQVLVIVLLWLVQLRYGR